MKKNWLILPVFLGAIALSLLAVLLGKFSREEKIFQEQIPLNGLVYDEAFLKETEKLPGIQSVTPVVPLAVHLSMEEYSMDTELFGVELTDLQYQAEQASDTALGRTPVLDRKRSTLCVFGQQWPSDLGKTAEPASRRLSGSCADCFLPGTAGAGLPCRVAAILKEPADQICFLLIRPESGRQYGQPFSVKKICSR